MNAHQPYMHEAKQSEQHWYSSACTKQGSQTGLMWLSASNGSLVPVSRVCSWKSADL